MLSYAKSDRGGKATFSLIPTLDNQAWNVKGTERAEYIEASSFTTDGADGADDAASPLRYGTLVDNEIPDWITQSGNFIPLKSQNTNETLRGGIRLLLLEGSNYPLLSFDIRKETYLTIEEHFQLPENTLSALSAEGGMFTHSLDFDERTGALKRLSMILKTCQKVGLANYGLAFSHNFVTGVSTGILYGSGVTAQEADFGLWSKHAAAEMFEHIKAAYRVLGHPLFLPTTFIQHHLLRTDYYCKDILATNLAYVRHQLGKIGANRLFGTQTRNIVTDLPVQQAKANLRELTLTLSSLMDEVIWCCNTSDWQCSILEPLGELLTELNRLNKGLKETRSLRARIQHLISSAESIKRYNNAMREHGQADMNILYSVIAQVDNRLNARLAAASSRDSAAMKTLAFLTTLFLPGTFVASIFSTSMFNWQGESNDSGSKRVVSKLFWVYWAFTVPLTIIVAIGWRMWWNWEKKRFDEDVDAELKAVDGEATSEVAKGFHPPPTSLPHDHLGLKSKTGIYVENMKSNIQRRVRAKGANQFEARGV